MKSEKFSPVNFPFPLNSCQSKFPLDSGESVIPSAQSKNIIPKHRNAIQTGNFLHIHSGKWLTTSASECRADSMVWQAAADELEALARVNNPFHHDVMWWDMKNGSEVSAMSLRGGSNESQSLKFAHNFSFHISRFSAQFTADLLNVADCFKGIKGEKCYSRKWESLSLFNRKELQTQLKTSGIAATNFSRFWICCAIRRKTSQLWTATLAMDAFFVLACWRRVSWIGNSSIAMWKFCSFTRFLSICCTNHRAHMMNSRRQFILKVLVVTSQVERCSHSSHSVPTFTWQIQAMRDVQDNWAYVKCEFNPPPRTDILLFCIARQFFFIAAHVIMCIMLNIDFVSHNFLTLTFCFCRILCQAFYRHRRPPWVDVTLDIVNL